MARFLSTFAVLIATFLHFIPAQAAGIIGDDAVGTIWTFENETWIENLAVRQTGGVLCTSINRAVVYLVDPFEHTACIVHQFDPTDGVLGIAEIENDVFVVGTANISLSTSTAFPGSAKLWRIDMVAWELGQANPVQLIASLTGVELPDGITALPDDKGVVLIADTSKGVIWRVDVTTGDHDVAISDDLFLINNPVVPLGVDGIHILNNVLYFTNLDLNLLGKIPITANGTALGPVQNITTQLDFPDDFALAADGTIYPAGGNTLWRVSPNGSVEVLAGGADDLTLEGVTSAQFGRTRDDAGVLYLGTNGGFLSAVDGLVHGGQLLAVNVGV